MMYLPMDFVSVLENAGDDVSCCYTEWLTPLTVNCPGCPRKVYLVRLRASKYYLYVTSLLRCL